MVILHDGAISGLFPPSSPPSSPLTEITLYYYSENSTNSKQENNTLYFMTFQEEIDQCMYIGQCISHVVNNIQCIPHVVNNIQCTPHVVNNILWNMVLEFSV